MPLEERGPHGRTGPEHLNQLRYLYDDRLPCCGCFAKGAPPELSECQCPCHETPRLFFPPAA
jgi:hypothetical protein